MEGQNEKKSFDLTNLTAGNHVVQLLAVSVLFVTLGRMRRNVFF